MSCNDDMIYLYWGNKTMSFLRYMTVYSACKYNKHVTMILKRGESVGGAWGNTIQRVVTDANTCNDYMPLLLGGDAPANLTIAYLEDFAPDIPQVSDVHISDMLTWYVLAHYGGTVADMDILFIGAAPEIKSDVCIVKIIIKSKNRVIRTVYPVGFLQGRKNDFYKKLYRESIAIGVYDEHQCVGSDLLGKHIDSVSQDMSVEWLNPKLVYPFSIYIKYRRMRAYATEHTFCRVSKLPDCCIGIHWYGGASHKYNRSMTMDNYRDYNCTLSKCLEKVLCS